MASGGPNHALDSQSKEAEIVGILSACCFITTTLVALRVITRAFIIRSFGPDDWVLVVAQVLAIGAAVVIGLEQYYGLGRHIWTVTDIVPYLKTFYSSILVYNASLVLVKISIVLMYRRIFVGRGMRIATLVALLVLIAWGIALVTSLAMICLPIDALWDPTVKGHCMPFVPAFFAPACINMITDFSIFLLPLPAIKQLQLPLRQKIILSFILCLGLFTCVISIVRLCTLDAAATSPDSTWDNTEAALWSYLELTVALMAACLPTLRPLVGHFFPRFLANAKPSAQDGSDSAGRQATWGSSGKKKHLVPAGQYSIVSDSAEALYGEEGVADPEMPPIGMQTLRPPPSVSATAGAKREDMAGYKAAVERRGKNETVIEPGSPLPSSLPRAAAGGNNSGIRATTVIKQEYGSN